ncbi:carboxypeptidase-like regulatory domain-containing protein, partial [candidate division KSB1 bacterium]|nr:carboxypeptidase-like regulatory domain-containing protein [candidate division KSB1 bacterium]
MNHHKFLRLPLVASWLFCFVAAAFGQTAQVSGRITDATGAVVPGAQVTLTNLSNGLKREAVTNDEGTYFIPLAPLGNYEIAVRKMGFKPIVLSGLTLNVNQSAGLDFTLETGTVT